VTGVKSIDTEVGITSSPQAIGAYHAAEDDEASAAPRAPVARAAWPRRLLHYGLAFAILFGMWYFDRLRLEDFVRAGLDWRWTLAALALFLPGYLIGALRLQCILRGMSVACTFAEALSFTFYGAIGELALPVVIGGDLVKAVCVGRSSNRSTALASVLADRLIGLLGLCLFALLAASVQIRLILHDEQLQRVMLMLMVLAGTCLAGCLALVFFQHSASDLMRRFLGVFPRGAKLVSVLRVLKQLCRRPHLWVGLLLSVVGHVVWAISVIFLAYALNLHTPFMPTLLILPIVAFANTLSFAGGIGGGLLAFEYLFHHVLGAAPGDGARLGIAVPIILTVSKAYAIPWLFHVGKASNVRKDS
jgi:Lysylphosphatidylglycerol synthase TM region